jgi:hypothetical protein
LNSESRYKKGDERYTMYDMFNDTRRAVWGEASTPANVNSYRRQLQLAHLNRVVDIYLSGPAIYPSDARTLAANDLDILENATRSASTSTNINEMSRAHFKEVGRQIAAAKQAGREYDKF